MRQTAIAEVRLDEGKATSSSGARVGNPTIWLRTAATAIEFCCGGTPRDGGSRPTGWESGECRPNLLAGGLVMNQREFEADLRRQGYEVFYGGLQAGMVNPDHAHDWDARVMVIGGEITLTRAGKAETFHLNKFTASSARPRNSWQRPRLE
jgi:hypothetical protein